jgi:hypothetical protein
VLEKYLPPRPRDRERERCWSTRAADALRGFRSAPATGTGTTRHESTRTGAGLNGGNETGARAHDGHASTRFFIYTIGGMFSLRFWCIFADGTVC